MENKLIYTLVITETIILVDGCNFIDKDGLDFIFIWVHDRGINAAAVSDGCTRDESERNSHLEYKMVD